MFNRRDTVRALAALTTLQPGMRPDRVVAVNTASRAVTLPLGAIALVGTRYNATAKAAASLQSGQPLQLRQDPANQAKWSGG